MLLKTADWDDSGTALNALVTETAFLSYRLIQEFNRPARCTITLGDPDGTLAQKYDVDAAGDSIYIGPGRAVVEDPTATPIFDGRIVRAVSDMNAHRLILECEDWLSQLDDDRITYDMREKLSGNIRQSVIYPDYGNTDGFGIRPASKIIYSAQANDGGAFTDETIAANDIITNDMTLMPAIPVVNDAYYFGFESKVGTMTMYLSTQGNWVGTIDWSYWDGGAWAALPKIDGLNDRWEFRSAAGELVYVWTIPGDWATVAVNGVTAYYIRARVQTFTGITTQPKGAYAYDRFVVYDSQIGLTADAHNGMYLLLTSGMAGEVTATTGPYQYATTSDGEDNEDFQYCWVDDANDHRTTDLDSDYTLTYDFREWISQSNFCVQVTAARFIMSVRMPTTDAKVNVQVYNHNTTLWTTIGKIPADTDYFSMFSFDVPGAYLSHIFDTDGVVHLRFAMDWAVAAAVLEIAYCVVQVDADTTGYSSSILISDGTTKRLTITTDLSTNTTRVWHNVPYCVTQPIYKHIDTAELDALIQGDDIMTLTAAANIEHTTGLSARQYEERTRLEILQDLAEQDRAAFWVTLGSVDLVWKSTFNDGAPTAMTDASVLHWVTGDWDYKSSYNEYHVYGARIGDSQLFYETHDTTTKDTYGVYRTQTVRNTGFISEYDCKTAATNLVARDKDVRLFLEAILGGLSALRIGDEVSITSSYLGLTAQVYTVTHWAFDSKAYRTTIRLHPRYSLIGYTENKNITTLSSLIDGQKMTQAEQYIPAPYSNEVI